MIKIGLDAGHGLNTAGKQTPDGIKEWTLNDKVRDKVVNILKDYNCEIINVDGDEGKTDESLASRVKAYVNAGVSAFVSIHHNAYTGKWNSATGVEVFTDKGPTAKDSALAKCIYDRLVKYTGLKGRGIKANDWYVINQDKIPAVLVEGGFMDGSNDYKIITSDAGQTAYAKAVAEGLIEFLGLKKKSTPQPEATTHMYRVRKSWDDAKSQIGAFTVLENAKKACIEGYTVFDENGKAVYSNNPSPAPAPTPAKKSIAEIAKEVIAGKWGNGEARKQALIAAGYNYDEVQAEVKRQLTPAAPAKKSIAEIAKEVIAGKWGNGQDRKNRLQAAGYNYNEVQAEVARQLGSSSLKSYKVIINTGALNVRKGAGTNYGVVKIVRKGQTFTIVEEKSGWGKLSDGSGWISLNYTKKV